MPKRPRKRMDVAELAKWVVDQATREPGEEQAEPEDSGKNPAAVALGKLGGRKGGLARAAKMTAKQRSASAKKAAAVRWKDHQQ
ncbi:MAG: hypothetical protein ABR961_09690 [Thermoanaerobaculaceae bacterium]